MRAVRFDGTRSKHTNRVMDELWDLGARQVIIVTDIHACRL